MLFDDENNTGVWDHTAPYMFNSTDEAKKIFECLIHPVKPEGRQFNNVISLVRVHLNKVLQKFSTAQPSSSVAKHKLLRDTKKQQDNVITSNRAIMTS
jgi:hypothetical protein